MTPTTLAPSSAGPRHLLALLLGTALGYSLSRIGFTDYAEVHRMFVFADLRLFLVFMGAVLVTGLGTAVLGRWRSLPHKRVHAGVVVGGVLFGLGWAIAGACPGAALAQLGEGKLYALVTLVGVALGTLAFHALDRRLALLRSDDACG
ncbi:MAG: YeeE/YedE family protein [Deltaproteobacteria bacterium]|nr:YeeE/YedE family protein [Deltaproteobacteria bacterium]